MKIAIVQLNCFGGTVTPGVAATDTNVQEITNSVDLGTPSAFLAWCSIGYVDCLGPAINFNNAIAAEVYTVDAVTVPAGAYNGKLGALGGFDNLFQTAYAGNGQVIQFRLRVFGPVALEASMAGIVLYDF
jgi:hypothetical protein